MIFSKVAGLLTIVSAIAACDGCGTTSARPSSTIHEVTSPGPSAEPETVLSTQTGSATFYSANLDRSRTASGERYDRRALTAAHRTLPMHTRVRVTNLQNGKSVIVRINDRGPFGHGRIIDVSLAAARALDMIEAGVVPARVEVLR